jgi:hypothetical protein
MSTQGSSSARWPTQLMTSLQKRYRQRILAVCVRMTWDEFSWFGAPYLKQLDAAFSRRSLGFCPPSEIRGDRSGIGADFSELPMSSLADHRFRVAHTI